MIRETSNLRILKGGNNMTEYEMNLKIVLYKKFWIVYLR